MHKYQSGRVPDELRMKVCNTAQEVVIKIAPKKKKCKRERRLSGEGLQIAEKRRDLRDKGERKDMPIQMLRAKE